MSYILSATVTFQKVGISGYNVSVFADWYLWQAGNNWDIKKRTVGLQNAIKNDSDYRERVLFKSHLLSLSRSWTDADEVACTVTLRDLLTRISIMKGRACQRPWKWHDHPNCHAGWGTFPCFGFTFDVSSLSKEQVKNLNLFGFWQFLKNLRSRLNEPSL